MWGGRACATVTYNSNHCVQIFTLSARRHFSHTSSWIDRACINAAYHGLGNSVSSGMFPNGLWINHCPLDTQISLRIVTSWTNRDYPDCWYKTYSSRTKYNGTNQNDNAPTERRDALAQLHH
jgi:hypothetical protein